MTISKNLGGEIQGNLLQAASEKTPHTKWPQENQVRWFLFGEGPGYMTMLFGCVGIFVLSCEFSSKPKTLRARITPTTISLHSEEDLIKT